MDCDVIKITDLSYGYCFWVLLAGYLFSVISVLISWVVMILEARIIVEWLCVYDIDDFELDFYYLRSYVLCKQGVDLDDKLLIESFSC
jgi:hypothetical protein